MPQIRSKLKPVTATLAALPLAVGIALAANPPEAKKGVTEAEVKYQAGGSPWSASRCTRTSIPRRRR